MVTGLIPKADWYVARDEDTPLPIWLGVVAKLRGMGYSTDYALDSAAGLNRQIKSGRKRAKLLAVIHADGTASLEDAEHACAYGEGGRELVSDFLADEEAIAVRRASCPRGGCPRCGR